MRLVFNLSVFLLGYLLGFILGRDEDTVSVAHHARVKGHLYQRIATLQTRAERAESDR